MLNLISLYAGVISIFFCLVIMLSWYFVPQVWIADVSRGKQKNPSGIAQYVVVGLTLLLMVGGPILLSYQLAATHAANLWVCFSASFTIQFAIFAVDVLVIDWFIYMILKPDFMQIEGFDRLDDLWHHTKEGLGGLAAGIPISVVAAGIGWWLGS